MANNNERIYVVYMHRNKINGKVYIGIAKNVQRRWRNNGSGYQKGKQTVFAAAIEKYGWDGFDHIILYVDLTRDEAISIEIALIAEYKSNVCRYGKDAGGYNMTDGGDGRHGATFSDEWRLEQSRRMTGEGNPMYGKKHSPETLSKISASRKCKLAGENHPMYGMHHSEETKKKISMVPKRKGRSHEKSISVVCLETRTWYETLTAASEAFHAARPTIIKSCETCEPTWFGMNFRYIQLPAD